MSGTIWSKWFWDDWEGDEALKMCSASAQGLWMRMLCICAKTDGYLTIAGKPLGAAELSRATGWALEDVTTWLSELDEWGVFSRTGRGVIYCRRMIKGAKLRKNGSTGGRQKSLNAKENQELLEGSSGISQEPGAKSQNPESEDIPDSADEGLRAASAPEDWPECDAHGWAKALCSIAGPGLADMAKTPGLVTSLGELERWRRAGCSWSLDVLPVIQGRTLRPRQRLVESWRVFSPDVLAARDLRDRKPEKVEILDAYRTAPAERRPSAARENLDRAYAAAARILGRPDDEPD